MTGPLNPCRPVPKPQWKHKSSCTQVPLVVQKEVIRRSLQRFPKSWITLEDEEKGLCEHPGCRQPRGDHRGLVFAHRFNNGQKGKGMGGTHRIPTAQDTWRACWPHHLLADHGARGCC